MGTGMIGMQWIIFIGVAVVSWLVQMNLQSKFKKKPRYLVCSLVRPKHADICLEMQSGNGLLHPVQCLVRRLSPTEE